MKEYKLGKGWVILIFIVATLVILSFSYLLIQSFISDSKMTFQESLIAGIVSLGMIGLMVLVVLGAIKGKFVIDSDRIYSRGVFSTQQLMFDEIKGYRLNDKYILIEPKNEKQKKMAISKYLAKSDEIVDWLSDYYDDLDIDYAELEKENEEILNNEAFGLTPQYREERLEKSHTTAKILNWGGAIIGAWTYFFPNPYEFAIIAAIAFPLICIIPLKYFNGLMRIDEKKGSAYPSIFFAIFAPTIAICLRGLLDYNIYDYSKIWLWAVVIAIAYIALLVIGNKEFNFKKAKDYFTIGIFLLLMFGYGYSTVVILNCTYDKSEPEIFEARIMSKRYSAGKSSSYYFQLSVWGTQKEPEEISVSYDLYDKLNKNDTVKVYYMKGQFDIPWIEIFEP
jgi:hypothetical protein